MNEETMRLEAQAEWKNGEIEELKVILVKYELLSSGYVVVWLRPTEFGTAT
jgi:hypothetical protein